MRRPILRLFSIIGTASLLMASSPVFGDTERNASLAAVEAAIEAGRYGDALAAAAVITDEGVRDQAFTTIVKAATAPEAGRYGDALAAAAVITDKEAGIRASNTIAEAATKAGRHEDALAAVALIERIKSKK